MKKLFSDKFNIFIMVMTVIGEYQIINNWFEIPCPIVFAVGLLLPVTIIIIKK